MEFEPMLTPREKSPLPENFPRGGSNPRRCGQRAQTLPTSYSGPLIQYKMVPWIAESSRLFKKGPMSRNGLQEHVFTLKAGIVTFLHQSSKLCVTFIDLKDVFGRIDHQVMLNHLSEVGNPEDIISITKDIYTGSTFQVKTRHGLTLAITRARGIIQGCPWSVLIFQQGIDKRLR